jgi:survival-of-motor-neuron-related-splicing factor 30
MTVDRNAIRPLMNKRKREAEAPPPPPSAVSATNSPHVISGPASINPNAQRANQESEEKVIPNKRTIGSTKALGNRVSNWKDWNSKGVGKKIAKKESMFRSGTTVDSRGNILNGNNWSAFVNS